MSLAPGTRLGPYEIVAPIGAGGMGEVYRAKDTNLNRDVALKILPESFAADADRVARFKREAQVLASLNHPNIAAIYGIESHALVMELVEGEDLSAVIARGPIAMADALPIARQIADALEAAHEQGIVHRDLKPQNIKVRADGTVKVLDFGLAKAMGPDGGSAAADAMNSPTLTARATQVGMILGTAAYMSPEQAKGRAVDKRADIWAFGVVLYEMLTGKRAFEGEDVSTTLAAVLMREPEFGALPPETPPSVVSLVRRCLERDPKQRLRDIGDARVELASTTNAPVSAAFAAPPVPLRRRISTVFAVVGLVIGAAAGLALGRFLYAGPAAETASFAATILPPPNVLIDAGGNPARSGGLAVSRDGRQIAFVGTTDGRSQIFVRSVDAVAARPVAGTEGGVFPVWSPDGQRLAFWQAGKLKQIPAVGGTPQVIADMTNPRSAAAWGPDDTLLFHVDYRLALTRVSVTGGALTEVLPKLGDDVSWFSPVWLPDGRRFLVVRFNYSDAGAEHAGIYSGSIDSKNVTLVVAGRISEVALANGEIYYRKGAQLVAQAFDATSLKVSEQPRIVSDHVSMAAAGGSTVVYFDPPGGLSLGHRITWFSRSGAVISTTGETGTYRDPRISPDGRSLALARADENGLFGIWQYDIARNIDSQITGPTYVTPAWTRDGKSIVVGSGSGLRRYSIGAATPPQLVRPSTAFLNVMDIGPGDRDVLIRWYDPVLVRVGVLPLDGTADPKPVIDGAFSRASAALSTDGKWIAVSLTEGAAARLHVQPYPGAGARIPVTAMGADFPRWRSDGRELFFATIIDGQPAVAVVSVTWNGGVPDFGAPQVLFKIPNIVVSNLAFDVTPDGQRFVAVVRGAGDPWPLTVVIRATGRGPE